MILLGVTGGVGAGKSEILSILEKEYGAHLMLADEAAHGLMDRGGPCCEALTALLGEEVYGPDGRLDRKKTAEKIFENEDLRQAVNAIVHPAVRQYVIRDIEECRRDGTDLYVLEAALLLEENYDEICDEVWYIYADEQVRRRRLAETRGYSDEKTTAIMNSQMPDSEFRRRCTAVIDNSGTLDETKEQIRRRMKELSGE